MTVIIAKPKGLNEFAALLEAAARDIFHDVSFRLPVATDTVIAALRRKSFFDNPSGKLQRSHKADPVKKLKFRARQDIRWTVPYGRVMEFGPRSAQSWEIKPRLKKALKFEIGGQTIFAGRVVHVWTDKQLRPHVGPTLEELDSSLTRILTREPRMLFRKS